MNKQITLRVLATLAFIGTLAINALANILPINGLNTGQVSDLYPSLFTPAGITFMIWNVIYFLLAGFIVFSWMRRHDARVDRVLPGFILSCLLNITWILVWHFLLASTSVVIMLALLGTLIWIFKTLHEEKRDESRFQLWVMLPFTLYLAWICVATIANISALLVSLHWEGGFLSSDVWTVIMMAIAALLALRVTLTYNVPFFSLVVIWALFGIFLRWRGSEHTTVSYSAIVLITLLAVGFFYIMRRCTTA